MLSGTMTPTTKTVPAYCECFDRSSDLRHCVREAESIGRQLHCDSFANSRKAAANHSSRQYWRVTHSAAAIHSRTIVVTLLQPHTCSTAVESLLHVSHSALHVAARARDSEWRTCRVTQNVRKALLLSGSGSQTRPSGKAQHSSPTEAKRSECLTTSILPGTTGHLSATVATVRSIASLE